MLGCLKITVAQAEEKKGELKIDLYLKTGRYSFRRGNGAIKNVFWMIFARRKNITVSDGTFTKTSVSLIDRPNEPAKEKNMTCSRSEEVLDAVTTQLLTISATHVWQIFCYHRFANPVLVKLMNVLF